MNMKNMICRIIGHDTEAKSKRLRYQKMAVTIIGIKMHDTICRRCGKDTHLVYFSGGVNDL